MKGNAVTVRKRLRKQGPKRLSTDPRHKLNTVCPYFTMFPLEFPLRVLQRAAPDAVVLDAFCGRGTTNYAARARGLPSYGIDASPVAVAIARAKMAFATPQEVVAFARQLLAEQGDVAVPVSDFWGKAYHPATLLDICKIRQGLLASTSSDRAVLLRALMLGALHGPSAKDPNHGSYLSNQMQRTYAPKPRYAANFWQKHASTASKIDVIALIERRATAILAGAKKSPSRTYQIIAGDSRLPSSFELIRRPVTHVITSPPYYGLKTYVEDQWLRNWFLGGPDTVPYRTGVQVSHRSADAFARSLGQVWDNVAEVAAPQIKMVVRFGAIKSRDQDPRDIFLQSLQQSQAPWQLYRTIGAGSAIKGRRQAYQMRPSTPPVQEFDFFVRLGS